MRGQWNFETRTHNEAVDTQFKNKPFVSGITGEGNVAAALYDAYDTTDEAGDDRWNIVSSWNEDSPTDMPGNKFASASNCDNTCTLTLTNPVDLSSLGSANLEVSRFADRSLDSAEYLGIDVYDGSRWVTVATWSDDNGEDTDIWETETIGISAHLNSQLKIRINAQMSSAAEDVGIDYVKIY